MVPPGDTAGRAAGPWGSEQEKCGTGRFSTRQPVPSGFRKKSRDFLLKWRGRPAGRARPCDSGTELRKREPGLKRSIHEEARKPDREFCIPASPNGLPDLGLPSAFPSSRFPAGGSHGRTKHAPCKILRGQRVVIGVTTNEEQPSPCKVPTTNWSRTVSTAAARRSASWCCATRGWCTVWRARCWEMPISRRTSPRRHSCTPTVRCQATERRASFLPGCGSSRPGSA